MLTYVSEDLEQHLAGKRQRVRELIRTMET